ncbi:MAG: molybdenum cofactor biosynthesis protein MoaE [Desulfurococcaceae archaeon]
MSSSSRIIRDKVDLNKLVEEVVAKSGFKAGAVVLFIGFVKKEINGVEVKELEYTVYEPYATRKLGEIIEEESKYPGVSVVEAIHRFGNLKPGEPTVYIAVASISRKEAFETASRVLERIKKEVPIFKLEKRVDGEYWVIGDGIRVSRRNV